MTKRTKKGRLRDKPRRREHDRPRGPVEFLPHITDPRGWVTRQIATLARSVAGSRDYRCLTLRDAALRIARATYAHLRSADWGPTQLTVLQAECQNLKTESPLDTFQLREEGRLLTLHELFGEELGRLTGGGNLGSATHQTYHLLCLRTLEWFINHPNTPPGDQLGGSEKPC